MSIEFSPVFSRVSAPSPRRACSARRVSANRANARKSTGPRTAAGKRRVAANALRHGLCARFGARLPSESGATFNTFLQELEADLQPRTTLQRALFPQIANLMWRLDRLPEAQGKIFAEELAQAGSGGESLSPAELLARRFSQDKYNGFILLDRYERGLRNALLRLLRQFDQFGKRVRPADPDEPPVPREGDRPAWTMEQQRRQEEAFARREEAARRYEPPRSEYEAAVDRALWTCEEARRREKQTQTNPPQNRDSDQPAGKCPVLPPAPVTEQTHSPPHPINLSPPAASNTIAPPTLQKGPRDA